VPLRVLKTYVREQIYAVVQLLLVQIVATLRCYASNFLNNNQITKDYLYQLVSGGLWSQIYNNPNFILSMSIEKIQLVYTTDSRVTAMTSQLIFQSLIQQHVFHQCAYYCKWSSSHIINQSIHYKLY
jgi:hypothetical protein